jgi:hypothetical protein
MFMSVRSHVLFLAVLSALIPSTTVLAAEMSVRDILYLNQFEEGVREITWCDDNNFLLVQPAISESAARKQKGLDFAETSVKKFSMVTKLARPLLQYHNAVLDHLSADCLRNGEYAYVRGNIILADSTYASGQVRFWFAQLIDVTEGGRPKQDPPNFTFMSGNPKWLSTAPDGSVYGHGVAGIDLNSVRDPKVRSQIKDEKSYHRTSGAMILTSYATSPRTSFSVYGLKSPDFQRLGSYRCPAPRPGCRAGSPEQNVVYFAYTVYSGTAKVHVDLFTIAPDKEPLAQRWPIVPKAGVNLDALQILGVVLDERRCLVLLQPEAELDVNRINGRLRLDVYVAECAFRGGALEVDEPRIVGRRQASFMMVSISLHGEYVAIVEEMNMNEQPEDQAKIEEGLKARIGPCAYIYHSESIKAVNTICVGAQDNDIKSIKISPNAKYIAMEGNKDSTIVGREYRNNGTGPKWINNGDRP